MLGLGGICGALFTLVFSSTGTKKFSTNGKISIHAKYTISCDAQNTSDILDLITSTLSTIENRLKLEICERVVKNMVLGTPSLGTHSLSIVLLFPT